jgi:hypothetical protein
MSQVVSGCRLHQCFTPCHKAVAVKHPLRRVMAL